MSGAFTTNMDIPAMVVQLNAMNDGLAERFRANESDHQNLSAMIGVLGTSQSELGGRVALVQQEVEALKAYPILDENNDTTCRPCLRFLHGGADLDNSRPPFIVVQSAILTTLI